MSKEILISSNIFRTIDIVIPIALIVGLISGISLLVITLKQPRDSNITYTERTLLLIEIASLIIAMLPLVVVNILLFI